MLASLWRKIYPLGKRAADQTKDLQTIGKGLVPGLVVCSFSAATATTAGRNQECQGGQNEN